MKFSNFTGSVQRLLDPLLHLMGGASLLDYTVRLFSLVKAEIWNGKLFETK